MRGERREGEEGCACVVVVGWGGGCRKGGVEIR